MLDRPLGCACDRCKTTNLPNDMLAKIVEWFSKQPFGLLLLNKLLNSPCRGRARGVEYWRETALRFWLDKVNPAGVPRNDLYGKCMESLNEKRRPQIHSWEAFVGDIAFTMAPRLPVELNEVMTAPPSKSSTIPAVSSNAALREAMNAEIMKWLPDYDEYSDEMKAALDKTRSDIDKMK